MRAAASVAVALTLAGVVQPALAQDDGGADGDEYRPVRYGSKGLEFETRDGNTFLWLGLRFQFRYTNLKGDPVDPAKLPDQKKSEFSLNRGRIKGGGHLFRPWFNLYSEYDFASDTLLDYRTTLKPSDWLHIRAGQWKTEYNRERVDSSGKQQLVDRSIVNYWFTVDRQLGLSAQGRLGAGSAYDSRFWFALVSGAGRGGEWSDDDHLWIGRFQWNFLGEDVAFSQCDLKPDAKSRGEIGVGGVLGQSRYTRFSSDGGGQLPGYEPGTGTQYRIRQLMQDSVYKLRGFSWQQELHWKEIEDTLSGSRRRLWGSYAQLGYFFHQSWAWVPPPLEIAARFALVDPDTSVEFDLQEEVTFGANWFINGHRSKVTVDTSFLELDAPTGRVSETRFRAQWDVSF